MGGGGGDVAGGRVEQPTNANNDAARSVLATNDDVAKRFI
jgi:hypothetical protein